MPVDRCQPIRDRIDALEADILSLQELLPELASSHKARVKATIKLEKAMLTREKKALTECLKTPK